MSQIDDLQARIMEALDRIGRGVEARAMAGPGEGAAEGVVADLEAGAAAAEVAKIEAEARAETAEAARAEIEAKLAEAEAARAEIEARLTEAERAKSDAEAKLAGAEEARKEAEARAEAAVADEDKAAALREALDEEKLANAQLEERVKVLHARLSERAAAPAGADKAQSEAQAEALRKLDADLQSLRRANDQLRESNAALRAAHEAGASEPHLINKAMMAELEALRAARAADRDEVALVLAEIDRAVAGADDQTEEA